MKHGIVISPYMDVYYGQTVDVLTEEDEMYRIIPHGRECVITNDYVPKWCVQLCDELFDYNKKPHIRKKFKKS